MSKINDTFSLGRRISHVIYGNYCLSVCDLNSNNFISFSLLLCFQANFSLTGWHCSVTVKATFLTLYLPLKVSATYATTPSSISDLQGPYIASLCFFPVSAEKGITSPYKSYEGDILSFIQSYWVNFFFHLHA